MTTKIALSNIQDAVVTAITPTVPKITGISVTNSSYTVLDDTAVSIGGGYIKITGTGFTSGSQVLIGTVAATSVSFVSSTELRAQLPATGAGTYVVYVVATDGSVAIRVNGITFSSTPTWSTGSTLTSGSTNVPISIQLAATSDTTVTYALAAGSTLPSGLSLSSSGVLSGTITGISVDTTYNFTVNAIDAELQDSPRAFSITITVVLQVARSLRFNAADTTYLNRTPGSAGNRRTWTWSGWVKRGLVDLNYRSFFANGNSVDSIMFWNDTSLAVRNYNGSSYDVRTTQLFRDPSAWYHLVVAMNTTQSTASDRIKIYVNGVQVTTFAVATYPSQNYDTGFNTTTAQYLGYNEFNYFDGYMTEVNFIDGQALTPASFGESDTDTGVWRPKTYTGSYGTNGFRLSFSNNTSTTTLGYDTSGNSNNWTPNNFSVTAGAGNDSVVDSPTSYGTDTGVGGEVRGNYCTWSPLANLGLTLTNGNLSNSYTTAFWIGTTGTMAMDSGTWYFEYTVSATASYTQIGVIGTGRPLPSNGQQLQNGTAYAWSYMTYGQLGYNSTYITSGISSATTNDIIMVAVDVSNGKIWFGKNGTWFNSGSPSTGANAAYTNLSGSMIPAIYSYGTESGDTNFGQRPFAYTAPSGFKALCSQNLPTPAIGATSTTQASKYFNTVLYTGNDNTKSITVGFQPDFIWIKPRNTTDSHVLVDAVRGRAMLSTNNTVAEIVNGAPYELVSYDTNGFTLGSGYSLNLNPNGGAVVAWNWNAGGTTVTNTAGSITSQVRANTTSGFSIVTYTGNPAAEKTVGHGLGAVPKMIILKARNASTNWLVYHESLGRDTYLMLNTTNVAAGTISNYWGSSGPNSTTFGLIGGGYGNNSSSNYVAYCFAEVPGYSRIGSWAGNGNADGPFVYCGFRPAFVMLKVATGSIDSQWGIFDLQRSPINVVQNELYPAISNAEVSGYPRFDILSNGFKIKTSDTMFNNNGSSYIFIAFAETPFKYARAR
jgi:hypothetical protein